MPNKIIPLAEQLLTGIDDATKCPCIGSIFVAGVVADQKTINSWKKLGVKDSKLVAPKKRAKLAEIIKSTATSFSIREITPAIIDDKTVNLNMWEMLTVCHITNQLQRSAQLTDIYVDNWEVNAALFYQRLTMITDATVVPLLSKYSFAIDPAALNSIRFIPEHRSDEKYTVVGAASILAKTSSDAQYVEYKKVYGNFGSGSPGDPQTRFFVWQHRHNPLPIIRTSWNTYKTLLALDNIDDDWLYARKNKTKENRTI